MSVCSRASSKMLEEIANRSQTKIYRIEGTFNDEEMRIIWNALGLYVSRNLRMGRGVSVPKLGLFTFTPPQVNLKGVTNEEQRDQRPRMPVFLIQKEFIKGMNLRTAIFFQQDFGVGLRPYAALGATGEVPITKMNLVEISSYANMSKDATELGLMRIIKYVSEQLQQGRNISLQLPNVGQLLSRGNLIAVRFNDYLSKDTRSILSRSVDERKQKGVMSLTSDNLNKFSKWCHMSQRFENKGADFLQIDQKTKEFLANTFDLHMDDSNFRRTTTNFDRTVTTKQMTQSMRQSNGFKAAFNREFNMALRILKEWVIKTELNSEEAFRELLKLSDSANLDENSLWQACHKISSDITEQQAHELFRILDSNHDGVISLEDWSRSIKSDSSRLVKSFLKQIRHMSVSKVLKVLGIEGVRKVSLFALKNALLRLETSLTEEEAMLVSQYISKGSKEVEVQKIIEVLNLIDSKQESQVSDEWESKFFSRIQRKMKENNIHKDELRSRLSLYGEDFIEQNDFKTVLAELGITLTLSEMIKLVKVFPMNGMRLQYTYLLEMLQDDDSATAYTPLSKEQFLTVMNEQILSTLVLPVSVSSLVSKLQSGPFKDHSQSELMPLVRLIDINNDGQISIEDVRSHQQKYMPCESSGGVDALLARLRQKCVKKRISVGDLFHKIDRTSKGFITREDWRSHISDIISYTNEEKEEVFNHMDAHKINMIDYQAFCVIFNAGKVVESEKFDWAQQALDKIRKWHKDSNLSVEDSFRSADADGDTYLSEKDLQSFLLGKIKYQQRELSTVRLQKLIKLLDVYKRGRLTFLDWSHAMKERTDWLQSAKHQIGMVLSRLYPNLSEAFFIITQGDQKMLLTSFEKWVRTNKVLSGFMANDDIMKHVFADMDKHRKGYLIETDFMALFGGYDWKGQHTNQFLETLKSKFKTSEQAFKCMQDYSQKGVSIGRFKVFVKELFGNRFHETDVDNIWRNIASGEDTLTSDRFNKLYGWEQTETVKMSTTNGFTLNQSISQDSMENQCLKLVNTVKGMILTSNKTLEQVFSEVDINKNGKITNLMFKKAFRLLNIALTSKDLDLLLNFCNFRSSSLIDWKAFVKAMGLGADRKQLLQRLLPKLQHLSDILHYYMISPKDAFRKYNNPKSGNMLFQEFHKMVKAVYEQAEEACPEYEQIKDLFEHIDIRKDGKIDFQEYSQSFRNCNPPNLLMGATPPVAKQSLSVKRSESNSLEAREQAVPKFKSSPEYEKFVRLVGRNRRHLQEQLAKLNVTNAALIEFSIVRDVLQSLCGKHGSQVDQGMIRHLIAFSMRGERVDYQILMEKFKGLSEEIVVFPKKSIE